VHTDDGAEDDTHLTTNTRERDVVRETWHARRGESRCGT
jgi:hypothetical protein